MTFTETTPCKLSSEQIMNNPLKDLWNIAAWKNVAAEPSFNHISSPASPPQPSSKSLSHSFQSPGKRTDGKERTKHEQAERVDQVFLPQQTVLRYLSAWLERGTVIDLVAQHISAVSDVLNENSVHLLSVHGAALHHRQLPPGVNLTCGDAKT